MTQESREKMAATQLARSERRGSWGAIRRAVLAGDKELAYRIVDRLIDRQQEAEAS
jgi:hypothetical protein